MALVNLKLIVYNFYLYINSQIYFKIVLYDDFSQIVNFGEDSKRLEVKQIIQKYILINVKLHLNTLLKSTRNRKNGKKKEKVHKK